MLITLFLCAVLAIVVSAYIFLITPSEKKERMQRPKRKICILTQFSVDKYGRINPLISEHESIYEALKIANNSDMAFTTEEYEVFDTK